MRKIAVDSGVNSLLAFYGADDSEMAEALIVSHADKFRARWFEANDGLESVRVLRRYLERNPDSVDGSAAVIADLRDFERVLKEAARRQLKRHVEVDY